MSPELTSRVMVQVYISYAGCCHEDFGSLSVKSQNLGTCLFLTEICTASINDNDDAPSTCPGSTDEIAPYVLVHYWKTTPFVRNSVSAKT